VVLRSRDTIERRLLFCRDSHVWLGAWNGSAVLSFREEDIEWIYTIAHAIHAWMNIRDLALPQCCATANEISYHDVMLGYPKNIKDQHDQ
jgi:hypothetical protein